MDNPYEIRADEGPGLSPSCARCAHQSIIKPSLIKRLFSASAENQYMCCHVYAVDKITGHPVPCRTARGLDLFIGVCGPNAALFEKKIAAQHYEEGYPDW